MPHTIRPAALLVAAGLTAAFALAARADEYSQFTIPAHTVVFGEGRFSVNGQKLDEFETQSYQLFRSASGSLQSNAFWWRESEHSSTRLSFVGRLNGARQRRTQQWPYSSGRFDQSLDVSVGERVEVAVASRRFLAGPPISLGVELSRDERDGQYWRDQSVDLPLAGNWIRFVQDETSWDYYHETDLKVLTGVGRIRDVTGVHQALVIQQRLLASGAIRTALSSATVQRLADWIYLRGRDATWLDRPAGGTWRGIQSILDQDPAFDGDSITAANAFRALEPLVGPTQSLSRDALAADLFRERGSEFNVGIAAREWRATSRSDSRSRTSPISNSDSTIAQSSRSDHWKSIGDSYVLSLAANWSRPMAIHSQLRAATTYSSELHSRIRYANGTGDLRAVHILADRLQLESGVHWTKTWRSEDRFSPIGDPGWELGVFGVVNYYVEDHLSLYASISHGQLRDARRFRRDETFFAGVNYRLAGRLVAPGVAGFVPAALSP